MEGSVYLNARQEWDERYADLVLGKRNWQIAAAGMMAILHRHGEQRRKTS
jgi:type IV secretory pathway TrbF-like protein